MSGTYRRQRLSEQIGLIDDKADIPFTNLLSLLFDGVDELVAFGDVAPFQFERTDVFSFSIWFKTSTPSRTLISKKLLGASDPGYQIHMHSGGKIEFHLVGSGGGEIDVESPSGFDDGVWHNTVVTYDGSSTAAGVSIYIDGVSQSISITVDTLVASTLNSEQLRIGTLAASTEPWDGNLDEFSVWDKELTSGEVTEIYNAGVPMDLNKHSAAANLVAFYRNGDNDVFPTLTDNKGSNNGTMTNMEAGDIVSDVP